MTQTLSSPAPTLGSPIRTPGTVRSATSFANTTPSKAPKKAVDKLEDIFAVHDVLIDCPAHDVELPWTNIVSVGLQSAGKSTILSMISGIPLWSANKTATIAPTQVHSRHRAGSSFSATISISDGKKRLSFTTDPIVVKDALAHAMRLAGFEARRLDEEGRIHTYETLITQSREVQQKYIAQQIAVKNAWTSNRVVLHVSGPAQANVSILDMPGLMGGPYGSVTYNLVKAEISKPQNIILLCIAGGGADPSCDSPEVKVVQECDPKGSRTMGLITKADKIDIPESYAELLTNTDENWSFKPKHGWWAVSPRTHAENEKSVSDTIIRARQTALFAGEEWRTLQEKCGVEFGTDGVKASLYKVFEQTVVKNVDSIRKILQAKNVKLHEELSLLPAEVARPVGALHDLIIQFCDTLRNALTKENDHTTPLIDLQVKLDHDLLKFLPVFIPILQDDADLSETYESPLVDGWNGDGSNREIWLGEVLTLVKKYTCARDQSMDASGLRHQLITACAQEWRLVCKNYVKSVWDAVHLSVGVIAKEVCGGRDTLQGRICELLADKEADFHAQTLKFVEQQCRQELVDPRTIDILGESVQAPYKALVCHFTAFFASTYDVFPPSPLVTPTTRNAVNPTARRKIDITTEQFNSCSSVMASVSVWLVKGHRRLSSVVGRHAQAEALRILDEIIPALREGFGLEEVSRTVAEMAKRLLEPDTHVVEKRQSLKRRLTELEDVHTRLKRVNSAV